MLNAELYCTVTNCKLYCTVLYCMIQILHCNTGCSKYVLLILLLPLQVGGAWQPTADGTRLVGRMVLKKLGHNDWRDSQAGSSSSATLLGLKVSLK